MKKLDYFFSVFFTLIIIVLSIPLIPVLIILRVAWDNAGNFTEDMYAFMRKENFLKERK